MIRALPSISTTGSVGRLEHAEVGQQVVLAGGAQLLERARARGPWRRRRSRWAYNVPVVARRDAGSRSVPVASKRELNTFIKLPWRLYRNEPNWVPPLRVRAQAVPRPRAQPVLRARRGRVLPGLARRPRRSGASPRRSTAASTSSRTTTGGCSASSSARTTRRPRDALLDAAEAWLRERGRDRMVGPMDFTTNDECGVLVEGHERPPIDPRPTGTTRYYPALLEGDGLTKAMDLLMWSLHVSGRARSCTRRSGGWPAQVEPEHGIIVPADAQEGHGGRDRRASSRSTTPPGSATGASCR